MCFLHFIRFDSLVQGRRYSSGVGPWSEPKRTSRAHLGRKPHPALAIILHLEAPSGCEQLWNRIDDNKVNNRCTLYHYIFMKSNESFGHLADSARKNSRLTVGAVASAHFSRRRPSASHPRRSPHRPWSRTLDISWVGHLNRVGWVDPN